VLIPLALSCAAAGSGPFSQAGKAPGPPVEPARGCTLGTVAAHWQATYFWDTSAPAGTHGDPRRAGGSPASGGPRAGHCCSTVAVAGSPSPVRPARARLAGDGAAQRCRWQCLADCCECRQRATGTVALAAARSGPRPRLRVTPPPESAGCSASRCGWPDSECPQRHHGPPPTHPV
jgi:hypothetical protein